MPNRSCRSKAFWITTSLAAGAAIYVAAIRPWHLRWGASDDEVNRPMPGDDLCPVPHLDTTRALTIQASPEQIWPWIVQIGRGRAGWYSYDVIDNLGCRSAERILPEFQQLSVGEHIPTGIGKGFRVVQVETNRFLAVELKPGASWSVGLYPQGEDVTRLVSRIRLRWDLRNPFSLVAAAIVDPGDFVMMRKMLLGIKRRAESQSVC